MGIAPKLKKPLVSLTRLEREKAIQRLEAQNDELLAEMGQESDLKALGTVQKYYAEQQEDQKLQHQQQSEALQKLLRSKIKYQRYLCNIVQIFLLAEDIPKKYLINIESNDKGILISIDKTKYHQAFSVTGIPKYDINACKIVAVQTGNTIARLEGKFNQSEGGIFITNKAEAELILDQQEEKYGRSN